MAVSSEVARVVHTANGTATFFSFAPIDGATSANLKVYLFNPATGVLTAQTLGTDYTFGSGGVTFNTAPPSGRRVILFRQVELLQPDIYRTNAPFPAVVTENRLDEIVKGIQQINDVVQNRSIILPLSDAGFSSNVLPAVENRKGRVLYFNATTGDPEAKQLVDTVVTAPAWAASFLSQASAAAGLADIGAVAKAGDTMTGPLTLPGAPTATNHAATKGYVDTEVNTCVAKTGDTMTGALTLPGAPTATNHAATKGYVDTGVGTRVAKAGDTMTGLLTLSGAPTASNHAATKAYVDSAASARVAKAGDTMTGFLTLHANPTAAMHAATKQYVDSMSASGNYVLKAGDTMTGFLTLHADPTAAMHAVTKQYVDRGTAGPVPASGSAADFTGIPDWANHIIIIIANVVTNNTVPRIQIGGTNIETTGYTSLGSSVWTSVGVLSAATGFVLAHTQNARTVTNTAALRRILGTNTWVLQSIGMSTANEIYSAAGWKTLASSLQRVRVYVDAGTMSTGSIFLEWRR